jgi:diguanylate cyclase (GGDEF)-like protein
LVLKKSILINIAIALIVATAIAGFSQKGPLKRLEYGGLDFSFLLRGPIPYNPKIVIIEITDADISGVGRWPWGRSWLAAMAKTLSDLGARYTYFDIILSEASTDQDDALFEEALKTSKNVYLPFVFQGMPYDIKNSFLPIKRFSDYKKGTGAVNIYPDIDGVVRRIPLVLFDKDTPYPHVALQIAMDYSKSSIEEIRPDSILLSNSKEKITIPLVEKNKMLIDWPGKWADTFKHYRFTDVLAGYQDILENKKPQINPNDFKDSICLVALTAIGLYDIKSIPLQPEYPGIGVIASTISDILNKNFLYTPPIWVTVLLIYLMALIPSFLISGEKPMRETTYIVAAGTLYFLVNLSFFKQGVALNFSFPFLALFVSYLSVETYNFVRVSVERQVFLKMSITDGLTSLYNVSYFKMLLETEIKLTKYEPSRKFSIVMIDVDHFKKFNDTYGHQVGDLVLKEVAVALNNSVRSSDIVARYGGEEMIILLKGSAMNNALVIAEKIRSNVENRVIKQQDKVYRVTISVGVSEFHLSDSLEKLIKRADEGLYKAKESGRNRVAVAEPHP